MEYHVQAEKGWVNRGNLYRLKELMKRAKEGDRMTLAFLGGSITQGCLSSQYTNCYAYLVFDWFVKKFPKTAFTYINAGVGGTTSHFGTARAEDDVLSYRPDFTIVEFSVNDDNTDFYKETYEGLIRRIYGNPYEPAVLLVHNICYDTGVSAEEKHREVGTYYNLPSVSMKTTIYPEVTQGTIPVREITPDDLHPNTAGHGLLAEVIIDFLEKVYAQKEEPEEAFLMPQKTLTVNAYEKAVRYDQNNSKPLCDGFIADNTLKKQVTDIFTNGWTASAKGNRILFEVEGSEIAIQYRKSIQKPAPIAVAIIDGNEDKAVVLDANFEETWGDCLYLETVAYHIEDKKHTVEVKIIETHENDAVPFYLVSVIASR